MAATAELCSKCKENPRADEDGSNPWCNPCRAEYQRSYNATKEGRAEERGYQRGVQALRAVLVAQFFAQGGNLFTATSVAGLILQVPIPQREA